jgi:hypothetical protein
MKELVFILPNIKNAISIAVDERLLEKLRTAIHSNLTEPTDKGILVTDFSLLDKELHPNLQMSLSVKGSADRQHVDIALVGNIVSEHPNGVTTLHKPFRSDAVRYSDIQALMEKPKANMLVVSRFYPYCWLALSPINDRVKASEEVMFRRRDEQPFTRSSECVVELMEKGLIGSLVARPTYGLNPSHKKETASFLDRVRERLTS